MNCNSQVISTNGSLTCTSNSLNASTPHTSTVVCKAQVALNKEDSQTIHMIKKRPPEAYLNERGENTLVSIISDGVEGNQNSNKQDLQTWVKVDGLESDLVRDFDENLTGLGLDLGTSPYNMREVLNLPIFKEETMFGVNSPLPPLQYTLIAPTSPATKTHEESLTYLNQGQSYEIRLKRSRDLPELCLTTLVKSKVRVVFHDRRLQYTENKHFEAWKVTRPGDRLVNIDVPMSVGIMSPTESADQVNVVEFIWDTEKEISVWVQVHCISTEFTPRKHGGEKGVPFRIQIDTYMLENNIEAGDHIHSASCQIKVFKPKGADRKQKTDKDKMEKRPAQERQKYQPSCQHTLLRECPPANNLNEQTNEEALVQSVTTTSHINRLIPGSSGAYSELPISVSHYQTNFEANRIRSVQAHDSYNTTTNSLYDNTVITQAYFQKPSPPECSPSKTVNQILTHSTVAETQMWLTQNRFFAVTKTLQNFSGADLLVLSREDLIHICGYSEGVRLHNGLHPTPITPRLTLFLTCTTDNLTHSGADFVYKASYLEKATLSELTKAVSFCVFDDDFNNVQSINENRIIPNISRILYQPLSSTIHVLVTDQVVSMMKNESSYICSLLKTEVTNTYQIILKPT